MGNVAALKGCEAVFLLKLMNLNHNSNLGEAVFSHLVKDKWCNPRFIENFIEGNQKKVGILLDGYDEFKGKGLKPEHCGNIVRLLRKEYLPDVKLLVTTRPGRVTDFLEDGHSQKYRICEVTGFSSSDIDKYIDHAFKENPTIGKKLNVFLEESKLKVDLACLPLMCCAFCLLAEQMDGENLKNIITMSSLLDSLVDCISSSHHSSRANRSVNKAFLLDLGKVALNGFLKSDVEELIFTQEDFEKYESAVTIIDWGCEHGILCREEDYDTDVGCTIRFTLKIFQEKVAGMYLAHLLSRRPNIGTRQWIQLITEKLRLYFKFKGINKKRIMDIRISFSLRVVIVLMLHAL